MIATFVKVKIGHEQKFHAVNNAKLVETWRIILRQCKNDELKTDVQTLREGFSRALDKKNAHIKLLMKELNEVTN